MTSPGSSAEAGLVGKTISGSSASTSTQKSSSAGPAFSTLLVVTGADGLPTTLVVVPSATLQGTTTTKTPDTASSTTTSRVTKPTFDSGLDPSPAAVPPEPQTSRSLGKGTIAGIALGVVLAIMLLAATFGFILTRRRKRLAEKVQDEGYQPAPAYKAELDTKPKVRFELDAGPAPGELDTSWKPQEMGA